VPSTKLLLITGDQVEVDGSTEDVERRLQDAARSTSGTLARLNDAVSGQAVGVNPTHVVTLRPGDE
jgi:hypothetical protein